MSPPIYAGVNGVVKELKELYTGVGGIVKPMTEMWAGIGGVQRQIFSSGTPVGSLSEGSVIQLNEDGAPVDFYVAKHDYESGLNGDGRTLVVRKYCVDTRIWSNGRINAWATSSLLSWLNGTYKALLDSDIQSLIGITTYYYTIGNGSINRSSKSDPIFMLSLAEFGKSDMNARHDEGSVLPIAELLETAKLNGTETNQWTRSPFLDDKRSVWYLGSDGYFGNKPCTNSFGARPVFTLPSNFLV